MLSLILFVVLVIFSVSSITGIVSFWCDVRQFKSDIEFCGSRKQLIEYLMLAPAPEAQSEEVNDNDDQASH